MKKLVLILGSFTLALNAFAGSDSLKCTTTDGKIILDGSLWMESAEYSYMETIGRKLQVLSIADARPIELSLDNDDAYTEQWIQKTSANIANLNYGASLLAAAGKANYLVNEITQQCREIGYQEFTQDVVFVEVFPKYNYTTNSSDPAVKKTTKTLQCVYTYATAPGGGPECHH